MATKPVLTFWERNPPFAAFAAIHLSHADVQCSPDPKATKETIPTLTFPSGETLEGVPIIIRYAIRSGKESGLYGSDALAACQVDSWIDYTSSITPAAMEPVCTSINSYLAFRTFLVGYTVTAADVAIWGALQGSPLWKKVRTSGKIPHLSRWFDFMAALPECKAAIEVMEVKKRALATDATTAGKGGGNTGSFDVDLPGAETGKVVTRFPPEPSGYLHIGHAKAALLNQHFADMYKGKLIVRFDDTNPSKEKDEFVDNILKDIADLGLRYDRLTYTSDYFPQMLELGEKLIKAGVLYADDTPVEQMREERMAKVESKCRGRPVADNLAAFEEMKRGSEEGLKYCIRFKFNMQDPNGCMRDPVAFRCNLQHHWRTGHKYKVYPTYDFACPFVDSLEGVTHALRTSEYKDREPQYYRILQEQQKVWPGLPKVNIWDYSRLNFVNTVLSKRKLTWFVDSGKVSGWNDPRMPTVQGVLRRGMCIEALREFIISQGASRNVTVQEWDKIWTINKKIIDPVCPRHTAVEGAGRIPLTLSNGPSEDEVVTVPRHKKHPPAGKKAVVRSSKVWVDAADAALLKADEEFTLMDWGNAIVRGVSKDASGAITGLTAELHLEGDVKKTKWKLTWLAQSADLVDLTLVDFDYLVTKRKLEEEDNFLDFVNPKSRFETAALGDPNMRTLQKGDIIQLERRGYFIVDEPLARQGKPVVLFSIPDGRTKNMTK